MNTPVGGYSIIIDRRFCGPPASGNGGYVCGRLASYIDGCAKVRLIIPPPLDTPLRVVRTPAGVELLCHDQLVAKAWPHHFEQHVPACPTLADAREMASRYGGFDHHVFPTCFVCGPGREEGDGLRIFPGLSHDSTLVSSPWVVDHSLCDEHGKLYPWFVWCALDCPSGWAFLHGSERPAVLGEFSVQINSTIACGQELIVVGWEIQRLGRKHHTGSALYSAAGVLLASGQATWFEIKAGCQPPMRSDKTGT